MEENTIIITINKEMVKLLSNSPDLKQLVNLITKQEKDFDFSTLEVDCADAKFDKDGFKEILINSIELFRKNIEIEEQTEESEFARLEKQKSLIVTEKYS